MPKINAPIPPLAVGDRVRFIYQGERHDLQGKMGRVTQITDNGRGVSVDWDNGYWDQHGWRIDCFKKVEEAPVHLQDERDYLSALTGDSNA